MFASQGLGFKDFGACRLGHLQFGKLSLESRGLLWQFEGFLHVLTRRCVSTSGCCSSGLHVILWVLGL